MIWLDGADAGWHGVDYDSCWQCCRYVQTHVGKWSHPCASVTKQYIFTKYSDMNDIIWAFSALTLLVGRQEGHPACKKLSGGVLAWLSVWSKVQTCIWPSWCYCHSLSLASVKCQIDFTFLVPAHPGSPGKTAVKRVCVCCKWTGLSVEESARMTEDRDKWRKYVHSVANPRI